MIKFGSISLVLILLMSTWGVAINKHYCGNRLASIGIYHDAGCPCGDMGDEDGCCHNETEVYQFDEDYSQPVLNLDMETFVVGVIATNYMEILNISSYTTTDYLNYKPPLLLRDISILVQCFRI